jgi:hypothetical protein
MRGRFGESGGTGGARVWSVGAGALPANYLLIFSFAFILILCKILWSEF